MVFLSYVGDQENWWEVERNFSPVSGIAKHKSKPGDSTDPSKLCIFLQNILEGLLVWGETTDVTHSITYYGDVITTHTTQAIGNFKLLALISLYPKQCYKFAEYLFLAPFFFYFGKQIQFILFFQN